MQPLSRKWNDIYHGNLLKAFQAKNFELINHTFEIDDPLNCLVESDTRGFRLEFSDLMFDWIMSGQTKISKEMLALNPNAAKFETSYDVEEYGTIITAYGPRIMAQWKHVIHELTADPDSRRACIMLLDVTDQFVAAAMIEGKTKCEYICTYGFNFRIRDGKLDMHVSMRSNNYTTTVCQDVHIFTKIQQAMASELGASVGKYYHCAVSGHILKHEIKRARDILAEYVGKFDSGKFNPFIGWNAELFETTFDARVLDLKEQGVL